MILTLCLSFAQLNSVSHIAHPTEITQTLKQRLTHQWAQQNSQTHIEFDNPNCAFQGTYFFNEEQAILSADHNHWRGRLELGFTDLLEGRHVDFSRVSLSDPLRIQSPQNINHSQASSSQFRKWLPWTLAAVGLAASVFLVVEREKHIRDLNRAGFSF